MVGFRYESVVCLAGGSRAMGFRGGKAFGGETFLFFGLSLSGPPNITQINVIIAAAII